MPLKWASVAGTSVVLIAAACGPSGSSTSSHSELSTSRASITLIESPSAQSRIDALRAKFRVTAPSLPGAALGASRITRFEVVDEDHFRAVIPIAQKNAVAKPASLVFPARSSSPISLIDDTTKMAIRFALHGAAESTVQFASGMVLYPGALNGADVVHRIHPEGTEDYVAFDSRPASEELAYDVDVSQVSGLRLVSNTLEFLDRDASPRLRIAPPYVIDANGISHGATLSVDGCAYDDRPAVSSTLTPIEASTCTVRITWHGVTYPALVDPNWSATGSLAAARTSHTATLLTSGKVLVTGGASSSYLASAELYNPTLGTFSATGSMNTGREFHTATLLANGKVLVAGGAGSGGYFGTAEVYDPVAGTFSTTGSMSTLRGSHTATLLNNSGKVLIAGGYNNKTAPFYIQGAELYDPGSGTFSATGSMIQTREYHTATLLLTGSVLIVGGATSGGPCCALSELYDPQLGTFSYTYGFPTSRQSHTATLLPSSGKVLIAGGQGSSGYLSSAELYDPTTRKFALTGSMGTARSWHVASALTTGKVLVAAGYGSSNLGSAEIYDPTTGAFSSTSAMATPRTYATATLLPTGKVLVTAGQAGTSLASAELFIDLAGATQCNGNTDCESGFCVDGVCCDTACKGQCEACDVTKLLGTCSPVMGNPHGSRKACTGTGPCGGTCDGMTTSACTAPGAATVCASTCAGNAETDSVCDGQGSCVSSGSAHSCNNNLVCADTTKCKTACVVSTDCASGFTCQNGVCKPGATCVDDHTSQPANAPSQDCAPYKCEAGCKTSCTSVDDCSSPNVCNVSGQCVPPDSTESSGCAASGQRAPALDALFALAAVALVRRRRKARGQRS